MALIKKDELVVLYNEARSILDDTEITEGGPARFSALFSDFFKKKKIAVIPIVFSYSESGNTTSIKKHTRKNRTIYELVYNATNIHKSFKKEITPKKFKALFDEMIAVTQEFIETQKPDVVFLNGFNVTNWVLLRAAKNAGIPIMVRHAGVWKREISASRFMFSAAVRRIFYDMERDTVRLSNHNSFINEFSKKAFITAYGFENELAKKTSIIPNPTEFPSLGDNKKDSSVTTVGMVARWDSIKNHAAVLRLAKSMPPSWRIYSVTKPSSSDFAKQYKKYITVYPPMDASSLNNFYQSIDILILPSYFETFGAVAAEAIVLGVPVIVSEKVGFSELLEKFQLQYAIVTPSISGEKMVQHTKFVLQNKQKDKKKYSALVQYLKKEYSPEKVFAQYATIFTRIAER